jgi:FkbM family methyltransferase
MSTRRQTMKQVLMHLKSMGFTPATLVDVGVAYGTPGFYGIFDNVRYLLVDPLQEYIPVMEKICSEQKGQWVLAAAGPEEGKIIMNVHTDLSGSSAYSESEGAHVDGEPRIVPMHRLDILLREGGFEGPMLVKLDVQGAELDVLAGAMEALPEMEVIIMEVSMFSFYKDTPQFAQVVAYMLELGYVAYDIFGGNNRLLDDALGQVDICFVKENGMFRKTHHYASAKQREEFTEKRVRHLNPKAQ